MTGHVAVLGGSDAAWSGTVTSTAEPVLPEPVDGVDPADVTPGLVGFLVTFGVVLACIPLFLSMTGKLRRVSRRPVPGEETGDRVRGPAGDRTRDGAGDAVGGMATDGGPGPGEPGTDPRGSARRPGSTGP